MKQIKLNSISDRFFDEAWNLYEDSFPIEERRVLSTQSLIMKNPHYNFEIVRMNDRLIGIMLWWGFKNLRYIEHLATMPDQRGKGYGTQIVTQFIERDSRPILLEVEPVDNELKQSRINFYQRLGFKLNSHFYMQPSLNKESLPVRLLLMSYPHTMTTEELAVFVEECHPIIYTENTKQKT